MALIATFPSIAECGEQRPVARVFDGTDRDFPYLVEVVQAGVVVACKPFRQAVEAFEFADEFTRW